MIHGALVPFSNWPYILEYFSKLSYATYRTVQKCFCVSSIMAFQVASLESRAVGSFGGKVRGRAVAGSQGLLADK